MERRVARGQVRRIDHGRGPSFGIARPAGVFVIPNGDEFATYHQPMSFRGRGFILGSVAAALLSLAMAPTPALAREGSDVVASTVVSRQRAAMNQRVFDRVWSEVRREYYDPRLNGVDWTAARATYRPRALAARDDAQLYSALADMLGLLNDQHAAVSSPAAVRRQETLRTRRAVLGVTLNRKDDGFYQVENVRAGSPAAEAGIEIGWRLAPTPDGWQPELAVDEDRPTRLRLIDGAGAEREVTLTARVMDPLPAFRADRSRPGVVVLRVEGFEPGLGQWMGDQLADLPPETDVVIDLRNNPGGRLMEADAVLSCFLPHDQAWATRTSRTGRQIVLKTWNRCGDLDRPAVNEVAVVVNGTSRSAAELTPAALQEAGRAVVVGERTAGAVLISQDTTLPDGGRLTLSRADFVTLGGVRLEKRGVDPDVQAVVSPEDRRAGRDPALEAAIAALGPRPVEAAAGASAF